MVSSHSHYVENPVMTCGHINIMSHPMKKMVLYILLMTPKMNKWFKNNFHLMTHTSQVNKPKLKPKMSNH